MKNCQEQFKKVHFIGIGGIGVSALARYFLVQGAKVSGSDLTRSEITDDLKKQGIKISIGPHRAQNVPKDVDSVIYSPAVKPDNPELSIIRNSQFVIPTLSYPEALGELTRQYYTIAVSGSHGKSTTTAMIANILIKAGLDPTVIVGTKLKEFGNSNFRSGRKYGYKIQNTKYRILVIEADEWNASFLNYWPRIIVLTNIEREHLDYYRNLNHIIKTFREYVGHLPEKGILVVNRDDDNIQKMLNLGFKIKDLRFKISYYGKKILNSEFLILNSLLRVPGEHNIYNALAALTLARSLGVPDKISFKALSEYRGAWRRFEMLGKFKGAIVISDYAHHPTEIKATLQAAREKYPAKEIWCVFQPHQIQRTKYLFKDFVASFDDADRIFLLDIYGVAGRENKTANASVNSRRLAELIRERGKDARYCSSFGEAVRDLRRLADNDKVIFIMGAGDVWKIGRVLGTYILHLD